MSFTAPAFSELTKLFKPTAKTPRLKPGKYTAAEVLRFVRDAIKKEPDRLDMTSWVTAENGVLKSRIYEARDIPACGTAACMAGWINITTGHSRDNSTRFGNTKPGMKAVRNLGLQTTGRNWFDLDYAADHQKDPLAADLLRLFGHTEAQPAEVITRINLLLSKYRKQLTQTKVVVKARKRTKKEAK